jgi:ferrous iron transport protein A
MIISRKNAGAKQGPGREDVPMNDLSMARADLGSASASPRSTVRLSEALLGDRGVIVDVRAEPTGKPHGVDLDELQRRLLEFGFVEGARIEVIHEGAFRHDPIAVKLDDMRVALRRRDAAEVLLILDPA